jgi:murein DD-endopeptidase MepM/ murein hydrolase activator NlpD
LRRTALVLALAIAGCAPTARVVAEPATAPSAQVSIALPDSVAQGALVTGTVPAGSRVTLDEREVRVSPAGRVVFGVARERDTPLVVHVTLPDGKGRGFVIPVTGRDFPLERITGVPESTVNPPPAIAERIADEQRMVAAARTRDDARADWDVRFTWPVTGRISGVFGSQRIYNGTPKSPHSGLDVAAPEGTPVRAPAAGIVTFSDTDLYLTGGTVLIDHGHGISSSFLHLSRIDVKVGDRVEQGQPFALVGKTGRATGPHMHWGLNWFDTRVDPQLLVDPAANPQAAK